MSIEDRRIRDGISMRLARRADGLGRVDIPSRLFRPSGEGRTCIHSRWTASCRVLWRCSLLNFLEITQCCQLKRGAQEKVSPDFSKAVGFQRAKPFGRAVGAKSLRANGAVFLLVQPAPRRARNSTTSLS